MAAMRLMYPQIVVDGHDITNWVRSYSAHQGVGEFPTMTVELALPDAKSIVEHPAIAENAQVLVAEETRAALVALGWTPPEE